MTDTATWPRCSRYASAGPCAIPSCGVAAASGVASCSALVFCAEPGQSPNPETRKMPATKICPSCSTAIEISSQQIGSSVVCPQCGKSITVKRRDDATTVPSQSVQGTSSDEWQRHLKIIAVSTIAIARLFWAAANKQFEEIKSKVHKAKQPKVRADRETVESPAVVKAAARIIAPAQRSWSNLRSERKGQLIRYVGILAGVLISIAFIISVFFTHSKEYDEGYALGKDMVVKVNLNDPTERYIYLDTCNKLNGDFQEAARMYGNADPGVQKLKGVRDGYRAAVSNLGITPPPLPFF
jgi:predicted Zn finger-like uncharacterized protein